MTSSRKDSLQELSFSDLGARAETVQSLSDLGILAPFPIQKLTIPLALTGANLIGQARTGTGKTLAFGVPVLEKVQSAGEGANGLPQALIVVPTRELCVQVARDIEAAGRTRAVRVVPIYGGRSYETQREGLRVGADIVVGTPGRLLDLAEQGVLQFNDLKILVLDEADEMLDRGFLPDIEKVLSLLPEERQTLLFSATMPGPILTLARRFMKNPVHVQAEEPNEEQTVPATTQFVYQTHSMNKVEILTRILQAKERELTIVFCRTKRGAQRVFDDLVERNFPAVSVHGDLRQEAREKALLSFRNKKARILVATDVAARGIDIDGVSHVVNYDCPDDEKAYVHRIGRTGRAGATGVAVTLVEWEELSRWQLINKLLELPFPEPPETYHTSEHLYADLGIHPDVTDRPASQKARAAKPRAVKSRTTKDAPQQVVEKTAVPKPRKRTRTRRSEEAVSDTPAPSESSDSLASSESPASKILGATTVGLTPMFSG